MFPKKKHSLPEMETLSNRSLIRLILPLVAEQILVVLVSIVDALMVSGVGESAVAAVSLVDNINLFFIYKYMISYNTNYSKQY